MVKMHPPWNAAAVEVPARQEMHPGNGPVSSIFDQTDSKQRSQHWKYISEEAGLRKPVREPPKPGRDRPNTTFRFF